MNKKNKFSIRVSESFETAIYNKAIELVREGKDEGEVDSEHFGQLGIFIDCKPNLVMLIYKGENFGPELEGKTIYIGGNLTKTDT